MNEVNITVMDERKMKEMIYEKHLKEDKEFWKDLLFEDCKTPYEVSTKGRVRNKETNHMMTPSKDKDGYMRVGLSINKKLRTIPVHRLVGFVFIRIPDHLKEYKYKELQINHKDGIKHNNCVYNLEWCTDNENKKHAIDTGLMNIQYGEDSFRTNLTNEQVDLVCKMLAADIPMKQISEFTGIQYSIINDIKRKDSWKTISRNYKFKSSFSRKSDETLMGIKKDLEEGKLNNKEIAEKYGVSRSYITLLLKGDIKAGTMGKIDTSRRKIPKKNNDALIIAICENLQAGIEPKKIRIKYNLSDSFLSEIKHQKLRPDITKKYDFSNVTRYSYRGSKYDNKEEVD